jgi:hypothetical protein
MKRPSGLTLGIIGGVVAFVVIEVIVWWPDPPKKHSEEPSPLPTPVALPKPADPAPSPPTIATAPAARPGRTVRQLQENEGDELRRLEGCADKKCGDQCIYRCAPGEEDGRCINGRRPGACTVDGVCSTTMPAVCPGKDEPPP